MNEEKKPSFLDGVGITDEVINGPYFGIIYGLPGVGKTTLGKYAEKPFYIPLEKGVEKVTGVGKPTKANPKTGKHEIIMPSTEDEFFEMMKWVAKHPEGYKTAIIDSGIFLDRLFIDQIIVKDPYVKKGTDENRNAIYAEVKSIADYNFGTGYEKLKTKYETRFFSAINSMHKKGINVILIAHSREISARDDMGDEYKKNTMDMAAFGKISIPAVLMAKADWVIYMSASVTTDKKRGGFDGKKIINIADKDSQSTVIAYTRGNGAFDAKVRTEKVEYVDDQYILDIRDESTSRKLFEDLTK